MRKVRQVFPILTGGSRKSVHNGNQSPRMPNSVSELRMRRSGSVLSYVDPEEKLYEPSTCSKSSSGETPSVGSTHVLHDGIGSNDPDGGVDIIFVHGLGGDPITSWEKDGVCWPRDLLPNDLPNARIITHGYLVHNDATGWNAKPPGQSLARQAAKVRDGISRPIIFVGHGFGGLVIKDALIFASAGYMRGDAEFGDVYAKTVGVVFLGTPHVSSSKQSLGDVTASACVIEYPKMGNELLKYMRDSTEKFETQRKDFVAVSRDIQVVCVREQLPTREALMVPKAVSSYQGPNVTVDDIKADHLDIARFDSRQDAGYFQIIGNISRLFRGTRPREQDRVKIRNREILDALAMDTVDDVNQPVDQAWHETCSWILGPQADEQESNFHRWLLDSKGSNVFWLSGRPGSGKSTLMRYAFHDPKTRRHLDEWARGGKLIMAAFYLHENASNVQRNQEGLMRGILHQCLSGRPELIAVVFPKFMIGPWPPLVPFNTTMNLTQAFHRLLDYDGNSFRLCLFIDGLDEYRMPDHGDSTDECSTLEFDDEEGCQGHPSSKYIQASHKEISSLVADMGQKKNIKIVVSSRELHSWEHEFPNLPRLRVQMRSQKSIAQYCANRLDSIVPGLSNSQLSLCTEVARISRGDILWARLAIDMLVEGSIKQLKTMLDSLPFYLGGDTGLYMMKMEKLHPEQQREGQKLFNFVMRGQQSQTLISLAFALEGVYAPQSQQDATPALGKLAATHDRAHPNTADDVKNMCDRLEQRLTSCCAGLLQVQDPDFTSTRVCFMHQTAMEFVMRKDVWDKLEIPPASKLDIDLSLISGCVRHLKCFGVFRSPVLSWPKYRLQPEAWLLISNALRYAARVDDDKDLNMEDFAALLDELDSTCQHAWSKALSMSAPARDPAWGGDDEWDAKLLSLKRKHWTNFEPMECGKSPRRDEFIHLALQANLVNYVAHKLQHMDAEARRQKAQDLLELAVAPDIERKDRKGLMTDNMSACKALDGTYRDFHHDLPDSKFLGLLFSYGADAKGPAAANAWTRLLQAGRNYFSHESLLVLNLATGISNSSLVQNRQRWVTAVKEMLAHGADPNMQIPMGGGSATIPVEVMKAIEVIRESLEGEPSYAVDLVQIEAHVKGQGKLKKMMFTA